MTIIPTQLQDWARLAEAATPGPWQVGDGAIYESDKYIEHDREWYIHRSSDTVAICADVLDPVTGKGSEVNARFISAARTAVPELVREVERLRETVSTLRHERESLRSERRRLEEERDALRGAAKLAREALEGASTWGIELGTSEPEWESEARKALAALDAALASPAPSTASEPGSYRNLRGVVSFPPDYGDKP